MNTVINEFAEDVVDQLLTMVGNSPHACHLLIDGVFLPSITSVVKRWPTPVADRYALFCERAHGDANSLAASPWLLPITGDTSALRELVARCNRLPAVTLIRSPSDINTLLRRLKRWTVVNCGGMHFNFRYPDTRRLPGIYGVLTDAQRSTLFADDAWSFIGRDGRWHHLPPYTAPVKTGTVAVDDVADPELSDPQFAALLADSEADEQLAAIWQDLPENSLVRTSSRPEEVHAWATSALAQANRLSITDIPERTRLCTWVLSGDPEQRLTMLKQHGDGASESALDDLLMDEI